MEVHEALLQEYPAHRAQEEDVSHQEGPGQSIVTPFITQNPQEWLKTVWALTAQLQRGLLDRGRPRTTDRNRLAELSRKARNTTARSADEMRVTMVIVFRPGQRVTIDTLCAAHDFGHAGLAEFYEIPVDGGRTPIPLAQARKHLGV